MWDISIVYQDNLGYVVSDSSGGTFYMTFFEYDEFKRKRKIKERDLKLNLIIVDLSKRLL